MFDDNFTERDQKYSKNLHFKDLKNIVQQRSKEIAADESETQSQINPITKSKQQKEIQTKTKNRLKDYLTRRKHSKNFREKLIK